MNPICWRLVELATIMLQADEREAVRGDLRESGETAGRAIRGVIGLIARRQAALWKDWHPWAALLGVVVVLGPRLNSIADVIFVPLTMDFRTFWIYGVRYESGLTGAEETAVLLCYGLAALVWFWAGGFVLGSLSRRTIWITGTLYLFLPLRRLLVAVVHLVGARPPLQWPQLFQALLTLGLVAVLQALLFVLPAYVGIRQGLRAGRLTVVQTSALCAGSTILIALTTWTGGWPHAAVVR